MPLGIGCWICGAGSARQLHLAYREKPEVSECWPPTRARTVALISNPNSLPGSDTRESAWSAQERQPVSFSAQWRGGQAKNQLLALGQLEAPSPHPCPPRSCTALRCPPQTHKGCTHMQESKLVCDAERSQIQTRARKDISVHGQPKCTPQCSIFCTTVPSQPPTVHSSGTS